MIDREDHWFLLHDEKIETLVDHDSIDPTRFGGKNYERYTLHLYSFIHTQLLLGL